VRYACQAAQPKHNLNKGWIFSSLLITVHYQGLAAVEASQDTERLNVDIVQIGYAFLSGKTHDFICIPLTGKLSP